MCGIVLINEINRGLAISFTLAVSIEHDETALYNGVGFRTPIFELMTKIIQPGLGLVILVDFLDLNVLICPLFIDKVVQLVHLNVPTD